VSEKGLEHINELTSLRGFGVSSAPFADSDLEHLKDLRKLVTLSLRATQITDEGVKHLAKYGGLKVLDLSSTRINDAGLEHLSELRALKELFLSNTQISDRGFAHLSQLGSLTNLSLQGSNITDAGLAQLKELRALEILQLENTEIGDAGLAHLKPLETLRHLGLSRSRITDKGLQHLTALKTLRNLGVSGTAISSDGVAKLKRELPGCRIRAYTMKTKSEVDRFWTAKKARRERELGRLAKQRGEEIANALFDRMVGHWEEAEAPSEAAAERTTFERILGGDVLEGKLFVGGKHRLLMLLNVAIADESSDPAFQLLVIDGNSRRTELQGNWDDDKKELTLRGKDPNDDFELVMTYYFTDDIDRLRYTFGRVKGSGRQLLEKKYVRKQ
jgi:hypothetical protein